MEKFKALGLPQGMLKVISSMKFDSPTAIQEKSIPLIMEGADVIGGASTGSGKTLAFGSGIISKTQKGRGIQALVLTPTRELAEQVANSLAEFSYHDALEVVAIYGGVSMSNQVKKLSHADVVVATPGRLLDHLRQKSISLDSVSVLVLDEADRMWDMGFQEDVGKIIEACPSKEKRQTMLFTATISPELEGFAKKYMRGYREVSVQNQVDPSKLTQAYYDVRDDEKFSLLVHLLSQEKSHLVMIFSNTRRMADVVSKNLKLNGINAQVIHGGMEQNKRNNVLKNFDNSHVNVLVCTDVAARGLDISGVSHVYNYDIPNDSRDYVHRVGRTARAGKEGIAINLIASRDYDNFSSLQKSYPEVKIKREMTPHFRRVFMKMESRGQRGGSRNSYGRDKKRSNDGRSPRRNYRNSSGHGSQRSEGNFRNSRDSNRRGFRGSGRNTKRAFRKNFRRRED